MPRLGLPRLCSRADVDTPLLYLKTVGPIEPLISGKMCPQNQVFGFFIQPVWFFFFKENLKAVFDIPFSTKKILFEVCSASIVAESHRSNWNLESDNGQKGE